MPDRPNLDGETLRYWESRGLIGRQVKLPQLWRQILYAWLARLHVEPVADWADVGTMIEQAGGTILEQQSLYRGYAAYLTATR